VAGAPAAVDQRGQHVVGVQQRVVVGVDDLLAAAAAQVVAAAGGLEARKGRRVAPEVRRPVVAQLVQHQQLRAAGLAQHVAQAVQQAFVQAAAVVAQAGRRRCPCTVCRRQAFAHALAAALVVAPGHAHAGARQPRAAATFAAADARLVVVAPAHGANMQGSEVSVLVPQAVTVGKVDHRQLASCGVVWRA
jgi:hypothetical protein